MNVSGVCSSTAGIDSSNPSNPWQQRAQEFRALQAALNSGDLSGAQKAFAALQQSNPNASSNVVTPGGSTPQGGPLSKDFQALQSALQSGDLSGAQQAFATLRQDMRSARRLHRANDGDANDPSSTQASNPNTATNGNSQSSQAAKDFAALKSALQSGDLSSAQQAFAAYQQDMQNAGAAHHHHHHHHHGGVSSSGASSTGATSGTTATDGSSNSAQSTTSETISISLDVLA